MHCAFCPSDVLRRPKGHLDDDRARKFLGGLRDLGIRAPILLNVLGEPLLNKRIFEYLDLLEAAGHPVTLITNISLLGDKAARREILRHPNVTLALSLQTATKESYEMRGYRKIPFRKFYDLVFDVIEEKFRAASGSRLEVHVAANYVLAHDPTIQADGGLDLWPNFPDEKAERRFIDRLLGRFDRLSRTMEKRFGPAFAAERERAAGIYRDHIGTKIAISRETLPPDFHRLKDEVFWGFMALPNVFLVFKSLELWTRDEAFLKAALPPGKFVYVEDPGEPRRCLMAESFGLLANGEFVLCCLDYEGEMKMGSIDTLTVAEALASPKRAAVRGDAMTSPVCRRCKGNLFIFDTAPLDFPEQNVDKFGRDWWEPEPGLHGFGGRWTKGRAWSYVYARISARRLRLSFLSQFEEGAPLELTVFAYDETTKTFSAEAVFPFRGAKGRRAEFEAVFAFGRGRFYRIEISSPTFVPDTLHHNGDTRTLGLAVFSLVLSR
jgi:hypothetical protein